MSDYNFEEEEFEASFNGHTLWRIVGLTRTHWVLVLGFLVAIGGVAIIEGYMNFLHAQIIDEGIIAGDKERLRELAIWYSSLMVFFSLLVFAFIYFAGKLSHSVQYDIRRNLFNHLQTLSLKYYSKTPVGWIISRVTSDSERIAELISWGFLDITWGIMNMITAIIFMSIINWQLTLVVLPLIPLLWWVSVWFKSRILVHYRVSRKFNSKITGSYNEMITGVRVIKALNREESSMKEFGELSREMYTASYRAAWFSALFLPA
ncbi:MAG: ABC transporter transmembrane domain-containing protein, partial [Anaerolineae bacterium]|nr:ABC transporter transmembrane domain-containing protein [Anaerolineae bacterium]